MAENISATRNTGKSPLDFVIMMEKIKWEARAMASEGEREVVRICDETIGRMVEHHRTCSPDSEVTATLEQAMGQIGDAVAAWDIEIRTTPE